MRDAGPEGGDTRPLVASVRPAPDPAVLAAIVAAVEQSWPRPSAPPPVAAPPVWRFSGRWWAMPAMMRRQRPAAFSHR